MDPERGEESGLFLQLAVIVFHKSQPWDQDVCMSDLLGECWGTGGEQRKQEKGRRETRSWCDQVKQ